MNPYIEKATNKLRKGLKVKELIELLSKCDPEKHVDISTTSGRYSLKEIIEKDEIILKPYFFSDPDYYIRVDEIRDDKINKLGI